MDWPSVADLVDQGPWYKNRGILTVNLFVALSLLTSYTNGFDGSMANGLQLIQQWHSYFGNPEGSTLGLLTSVQNIGGFIALPIAPFVTDGLGRRKGVFIGGIIMLGGVALQAQATNVAQFIAARGMIGFGMTFSINAAPLLVTELAYPTQRGPITAVYNTTWYLGSIVSAWTTFGTFRIAGSTWSWRIPSILQALPSLLQVTLIWFCPESPRWLISKGRDHEAKAVLGKYHGNGDIHHPLVEYEYNEIREAIAMENEVGDISWSTLLGSPGNRRRLRVIIALGFFSQWSGNGLVSYYINLILESVGITESGTKTLINGILQIFNYAMAISTSFFVDRIGRRRLFLLSNTGMLVVFVLWTVTSALFSETGSKVAANMTIVMIFLYYAFYDIAWTPLLVVYTLEILPYRLRAKGFAIMSFTVSLALVFNQYVNPVALDRLGWKYYLFYVAWLAFELVFVFLYMWETKGRTLEQTAALFDGEDANHLKEVQIEHQAVVRTAATKRLSHSVSTIHCSSPTSEKPASEMYEMPVIHTPTLESWERAYVRDSPPFVKY
ncbi:hypothetical protein FRB95_004097 [Tulasnella sp. JGI-2019a]|nr:hypothetical protein FRB93_002481 [Tulasnella sp. JGI-2019a]KAG9037810.1 hypothetical protein FRB95_004097 [Tulasnella sp. JGI-2019a]